MMKRVVAWIGMILFILGIMAADSPNLIWPLSITFGGILLIRLAGGQESF